MPPIDADARRVVRLAREATTRLRLLRALRRMLVEEEISVATFEEQRDALFDNGRSPALGGAAHAAVEQAARDT